MTQMDIKIEDLYLLLGEKVVIIYKLEEQIKSFYLQADEMAKEITRLRGIQHHGKLDESTSDNSV